MPERGSPNLARRRRLAAELRRLREQAGLTGDEVADRLGWSSSSKLSRIELGRTGLKQADLENLLNLYQVASAHRDELTALAEESRSSGPGPTSGKRLPGEHVEIAEEEADAEWIRIWEAQVIPGLLQTENYTRALLQGWVGMFALPPGEVERRIEARRLRQEVLIREQPLQLVAVIDESVLYRQVGDPAIMHEQLKHVVAVATLPNVEVRILPLSGEHVVNAESFDYLRFRQIHVPRDDIIAVQHATGTQYIEMESDVHQYYVIFEALRDRALLALESRELISRIAHDRWT